MIAFLGHAAILLALAAALAGCGVAAAAAGRPTLLPWGRRAAFLVCALVALAVLLMEVALVGHDFSVKYVADVGSRETPLYYTVVSLWAALEGSILLWALLLSLYTAAFLRVYRARHLDLQPYALAILLGISAFFLFVIAGPGNPFVPVSPAPADGPGPNPLLQNHWMMGVHPLLLYCGYVGLTVPFAVTMASLLRGVPGSDVLRVIRRWALVPWVFLSVGIVAGMWWSYAVLGWGGYWSWDPVENVALMPWLVTTAFLHSLHVQERRQMLKAWTMSLITSAFLLSILGTFITRSDVLASVHSFTQSAVGPFFLAFLAAVLLGSLGLLFTRSRELAAPGVLEAAVCRETAFLFNNLLLVAITFTVLLGTMFPLIAEALQGTQLSVGAPYFNRVNVPLGLALLFLMGIGPVLPWGAARLEDLQYRLLLPVAVGVGVIFLLLAAGIRGAGSLLTFGAAAFVLTVTLARVASDTRIRRRNTSESWPAAARRLLAANPRRYGGYLVHVGVLLILVGVAASQTYGVRTSATLYPGQSVRLDGYTVTYQGLRPRVEPNRVVMAAAVLARRGNESLGTLLPSQNLYPTLDQPVVTPAVQEEPWGMLAGLVQGKSPLPDLGALVRGQNPFEDLYVVLEAVDSQNANRHIANRWVTLQVMVNPMVGFIWLGGLIVGLGGVCALLPAARRKRVPAPAAEAVRLHPEEVVV